MQAWNSNDSRIAKRMALLVFTDFICWAPIAFFALTAAGGVHLINLEQAKVFTVFILPLNSCCNPFLYAILTKQFKKDCVMICKAIEESRVTRGIGRCRHSSNFSNRYSVHNQCCQLLILFFINFTVFNLGKPLPTLTPWILGLEAMDPTQEALFVVAMPLKNPACSLPNGHSISWNTYS